MMHRAVGRLAATKTMAFHDARETLALAHTAHLHLVGCGKDRNFDRRANFGRIPVTKRKLTKHAARRYAGILEMLLGRFVRFVFPPRFDETELHRVVTVPCFRLPLHDNTRPRLDNSERDDFAVLSETLSHSELSSYQ